MRITLILLLILYAVKAHSADDVLFIDMNNSPQEIKAARESAEKSGRKLVVIPEVSDKDRKKLMNQIAELNALRTKVNTLCYSEKPDKQACDAKKKQYVELETKKSAAAATFQLTEEKLNAFLAANKDKTFSSVVISGHDGTGSFSGEFGRISDTGIAEALGKYPSLKDSIRTLHLWGCYTTSPGSLMLNWKKNFPNTSLITGYEGRAPLADKPAGWHYLKGVLAKEPELLKAGDSAKLQKLLKKIPGANQVTAAIYACEDYASLKDHYNIADLKHRCDDVKPQIKEKGPEFECYLKAQDEKCANPPENVGSGPVRQFYELLHKASACEEITNDSIFGTYSRDTAIRLVFSREIQKNFGHIYAKKLADVDDILAKMGAPERLRFKDIASLDRREVLQRADELLAFLQKQKRDPFLDPNGFKVSERDAELAMLQTFQQNFTQIMGSLRTSCVPFNWTEPDQKEKSECFAEHVIGADGVKKHLEPEFGLRGSVLGNLAYDLSSQIAAMEIAAGSRPDAATQARLEELHTQAEKLRFHSRYEEGKIPPENLKRIALREEYAKHIRQLASEGKKDPRSEVSAVKMVLEINRPDTEEAVRSYQAEIAGNEKNLQALVNPSNEEKAYFEETILRQKNRMLDEQTMLEFSNILASEAPWDSTTGKSRRLAELQNELGRRLWKNLVDSKEAEAKMYREYSTQAGLGEETRKEYGQLMEEAEAEVKKLRSETAQQIRQRGYDQINKIRYKY